MESFLQSAGVLGANDKLIFKSLLDPWVILAATLTIVALVILFYQKTSVPVTGRYRSFLIALKLLPLLLITCSLLEPVLLTSEVTPEQGFIIVLMDDSKSMQIQDAPGSVSRIESVRQLMEDEKGQGLLPKLKENFRVRTFRFSLEAKRIADKLEIHYTPKHGSWLNMAEIGLNILFRQCLDRRIPTSQQLAKHVHAWLQERLGNPPVINWQFTTADARIKLKRLYPALLPS